ncbi:hypothetical protein GW17_00055161 [Ensete ventricosum]|nr:hypothetical protein GW17_00055161 [Ensete ventricosum]
MRGPYESYGLGDNGGTPTPTPPIGSVSEPNPTTRSNTTGEENGAVGPLVLVEDLILASSSSSRNTMVGPRRVVYFDVCGNLTNLANKLKAQFAWAQLDPHNLYVGLRGSDGGLFLFAGDSKEMGLGAGFVVPDTNSFGQTFRYH